MTDKMQLLPGPFHVSRSSDGTNHWFSARDDASGVTIPAKDRDDAYALVSSLNRACSTYAARISHSLPGEVGMREAPDFEGLGDALGALSHKLRMSGFLVNDENHTAYERVVAEFQAVSSKKGARHG